MKSITKPDWAGGFTVSETVLQQFMTPIAGVRDLPRTYTEPNLGIGGMEIPVNPIAMQPEQ